MTPRNLTKDQFDRSMIARIEKKLLKVGSVDPLTEATRIYRAVRRVTYVTLPGEQRRLPEAMRAAVAVSVTETIETLTS